MFKSRRAGSRKCRDYRQLMEKGADKHRKMEGNSNITSNRITIPPGFLCLGVRSRTVRKSPRKQNFASEKSYVLEEDFQDLFEDGFNENHKKLRRSSRISKKSESTQTDDSLTAANGRSRGLEAGISDCGAQKNHKEDSCRHKAIVRNNSNSIFRKINERCARAQAKKSVPFNYPISAVISLQGRVEHFHPASFCLSLCRELCIDLDQSDYLSRGKSTIRDKIRYVNDRLQGKMSSGSSTPNKGRKLNSGGDPAKEPDFQYVPRCDWIYATPPRQRVVLPKAEDCLIQPAVICTTKRQSNIFELNPDVKVDLTGFASRQNVPVDGRYMSHLASFDERLEEDRGFHLGPTGGLDQAEGRRMSFGKRKCEQEPSLQSDYFSQVTCRPTKTVKKVSRTSSLYGGRSAEDPDSTPPGADLFQTFEEFERDITFVEEEGVCKIVNTQRSNDTGNRLGFKFRKNLFGASEQKGFSFQPKEPKMFDFSQLQNN